MADKPESKSTCCGGPAKPEAPKEEKSGCCGTPKKETDKSCC